MLKIVVIDDEKNICNFVSQFFKDMGYTTFPVIDPLKAISLIEKEHPDIILLDINMPGVNGLTLLKQIREINQHVKVIMVTIVDDEQSQEKARQFGADAFIRKPFTTEYLEDVVVTMIEKLYPLKRRKG